MKMVIPRIIMIMWVKQCHNLPMTGNGKFIPQKKHGDDRGMVYGIVLTTLLEIYGYI